MLRSFDIEPHQFDWEFINKKGGTTMNKKISNQDIFKQFNTVFYAMLKRNKLIESKNIKHLNLNKNIDFSTLILDPYLNEIVISFRPEYFQYSCLYKKKRYIWRIDLFDEKYNRNPPLSKITILVFRILSFG